MQSQSRKRLVLAFFIVPVAMGVDGTATTPGGSRQGLSPTERQLVEIKAGTMAANYRANLADLARWRDVARQLAGDAEFGYLAHYWAGFASWGQATNGLHLGLERPDVDALLADAATDFFASIRLRNDFADSYAAVSAVIGWRGHRVQESLGLLQRAIELDPNNPRVLWTRAWALHAMPGESGGDLSRALEMYRHALDAAELQQSSPESPHPDWGRAESLMGLALVLASLDLRQPEQAMSAAHSALSLQPRWFYVRHVLLPRLESELDRRARLVQ